MPRPPKPAGTAADQILAVRLTAADHALVGQLVAHHRAELSKLHVAGSVTPADVIRTLLRREAERVGLRREEPGPPLTPDPPAPPSPDPSRPEPTAKPAKPSPRPQASKAKGGRATKKKPGRPR